MSYTEPEKSQRQIIDRYASGGKAVYNLELWTHDLKNVSCGPGNEQLW